jgi:beta-glucuronidase
VRVDSRHDAASLPSVDFDWKNYGGITRPVHLIQTPETFIRHHQIHLIGNRLVARITLDGPASTTNSVTLRLPGLVRAAMPDADGVATIETRCRLPRWSPEAPVLNPLQLAAGADQLVDRISLRTIATRGRSLLLNGKPVYLKGIAIHEERVGGPKTIRPGCSRRH